MGIIREGAGDAERLAPLEREAQVLASLNHPHIAAIYGLHEGPPEGGPYDRGGRDSTVEAAFRSPVGAAHVSPITYNPPRMQISERTSGTVTIVDLSGVLNLGQATERLHDKINSLLQQDRKQIILNLGDVTSVDSGGLGELVRTHTSARSRGGAVKISNLPKRVHDLLVMTRLVTVFDTFDNEAEAVNSFGA